MNTVKEIKCLFMMMKAAKCIYFLKKIVTVMFVATLACMGVKCMLGSGCCDLKKKMKKML